MALFIRGTVSGFGCLQDELMFHHMRLSSFPSFRFTGDWVESSDKVVVFPSALEIFVRSFFAQALGAANYHIALDPGLLAEETPGYFEVSP